MKAALRRHRAGPQGGDGELPVLAFPVLGCSPPPGGPLLGPTAAGAALFSAGARTRAFRRYQAPPWTRSESFRLSQPLRATESLATKLALTSTLR